MSDVRFEVKVDLGDALEQASRVVAEITSDLELEIKKSLGGPRSGRRVVRYQPKRIHRASAPGEAPATDLGFLVNSISSRMVTPLQGEISISARYAEALELGTRRMAERPFVRPAIASITRQFENGK